MTQAEHDDALIVQGETLLQKGIQAGMDEPTYALYSIACFMDSIARSVNAIQKLWEVDEE